MTVWTKEKALAYLKAQEIERGLTRHSVWRHWKSGGVYRVVLLSVDEATMTPLVHYQSTEFPDASAWTRPATVFLENVKNGLDWVARFRREDA